MARDQQGAEARQQTILFIDESGFYPLPRVVRTYAPVGTHEDLLPYLVRRLLENGANSSFVHHFLNPNVPVEDVVRRVWEIFETA